MPTKCFVRVRAPQDWKPDLLSGPTRLPSPLSQRHRSSVTFWMQFLFRGRFPMCGELPTRSTLLMKYRQSNLEVGGNRARRGCRPRKMPQTIAAERSCTLFTNFGSISGFRSRTISTTDGMPEYISWYAWYAVSEPYVESPQRVVARHLTGVCRCALNIWPNDVLRINDVAFFVEPFQSIQHVCGELADLLGRPRRAHDRRRNFRAD